MSSVEMFFVKVKPSKYFSFEPYDSINKHPAICELNTILSYVLLLETMLVFTKISDVAT